MKLDITFKLARGSQDGEDFQDVFANGEQIGKLVWWTGASAGWYFEGEDEQPRHICPLESGLDADGEMILIPLDEVFKLTTEWLLKQVKTVKAKEIRKGQLVAFMAGAKPFRVTFTKKLSGANKGWVRVQYAQPEVPGGIAEQTLKATEELEVASV